jgi:hypothetical protein
LKEKLIKIGAKVVSHGRYVAFQMAEVAIPRNLFGHPAAHCGIAAAARHFDRVRHSIVMRSLETMGELCLDDGNFRIFECSMGWRRSQTPVDGWWRRLGLVKSARIISHSVTASIAAF